MSWYHIRCCLLLFLSTLSLWATTAQATWQPAGNLIRDPGSGLIDSVMIGDGFGGAYIAWSDVHSGSWHVYCQRIDGEGNSLWQEEGIWLSTANPHASLPRLVLASDGGVYVVWFNIGLWAQRLSADGQPQWTQPFPVLGDGSDLQLDADVCSDGAGGMIVVFSGNNPEPDFDMSIYAQRLASDGTRLWGDYGVTFCDTGSTQIKPQVAATSDGCFLVTWQDGLSGVESHVYAQKFTADGQMLWTFGGVPVRSLGDWQKHPQVVADTTGGGFVFWRDWSEDNPGLYCQHLDAQGNPLWGSDDLLIVEYSDSFFDFDSVTDTDGGAIVSWPIGGTEPDLFVQRLDADGERLWGTNGKLVVVAAGGQQDPRLQPDYNGGAYLAWSDSRRGCKDIFAQHLDGNGEALWDQAGVMVAVLDGEQYNHEITTVGEDEIIGLWTNSFEGLGPQLYALRLGAEGSGYTEECSPTPPPPVDVPESSLPLHFAQNVPNPFNPRTEFRFELPVAGQVWLSIYDLTGRLVATPLQAWLPAGPGSVAWNAQDAHGQMLASGMYFARLKQGRAATMRKITLLR